mgnify:CR=1 FL=1
MTAARKRRKRCPNNAAILGGSAIEDDPREISPVLGFHSMSNAGTIGAGSSCGGAGDEIAGDEAWGFATAISMR